jgi:hypothetical protein
MANNRESILAKLSASEALMDDGFVVCCRLDNKCETSVREDCDMLHCEKEHNYIWAYSQSGQYDDASPRQSLKSCSGLRVIPWGPGP